MFDWLNGKKTYIVGIGGILLAAGGLMHGDIGLKEAIEGVMAALSVMTLRHGITTTLAGK